MNIWVFVFFFAVFVGLAMLIIIGTNAGIAQVLSHNDASFGGDLNTSLPFHSTAAQSFSAADHASSYAALGVDPDTGLVGASHAASSLLYTGLAAQAHATGDHATGAGFDAMSMLD